MEYVVNYIDRDGHDLQTTVKANAVSDRNGFLYFATEGDVEAIFPADLVVSVIAQDSVPLREVRVDVDVDTIAVAKTVIAHFEDLYTKLAASLEKGNE